MTEKCALEICQELIGENFWVARDLKYHSPAHMGFALSQPLKKRKSKREKHSPGWRARRKRFLKEITGIDLTTKEEPQPEVVVHQPYETEKLEEPWAKVKYNKETYLADEVVILTRTSSESPLSIMLSNMRNVRMYVDDVGGVLIRPVRPSKEGGKPVPAHTPTKGKAEASDKSVEPKDKKPRSMAVSLTGSHGLNPAKPESKRWFLVESMLEGGSTKEIFKRAASTWSKACKQPKDKFGMVSTPSNARLMFTWLVEKVAVAGRNIAFKEKDGKFKIYDA